MATKIELDFKRLMAYQKLSSNLNAVSEYFRHGDLLIKEVNDILQNIQLNIDGNLETSFTKQDFNDLLNLRNEALLPIFQNASFALEFTPYTLETPNEVTIIEEFTPITE